jgi:hypothetical protein
VIAKNREYSLQNVEFYLNLSFYNPSRKIQIPLYMLMGLRQYRAEISCVAFQKSGHPLPRNTGRCRLGAYLGQIQSRRGERRNIAMQYQILIRISTYRPAAVYRRYNSHIIPCSQMLIVVESNESISYWIQNISAHRKSETIPVYELAFTARKFDTCTTVETSIGRFNSFKKKNVLGLPITFSTAAVKLRAISLVVMIDSHIYRWLYTFW